MSNLSEEEKKAIEFSEELHEVVKKAMEVKYRDNELKALQTIIKKQQKEIEELKEKDNYWKENAIPKNTINYLYVSKDKIREVLKLCNKNSKLLYEEEGTYNYFIDEIADKIRSLLKEE